MTAEELKQAAMEWIEGRIEAYKTLGEPFNPDGTWRLYAECPRCIEVHPSDKQIHVSNIEKLADAMQFGVRREDYPVDSVKYEKLSFKCKGYTFFEIRKVEEEED